VTAQSGKEDQLAGGGAHMHQTHMQQVQEASAIGGDKLLLDCNAGTCQAHISMKRVYAFGLALSPHGLIRDR
jgi:hypothetical protein